MPGHDNLLIVIVDSAHDLLKVFYFKDIMTLITSLCLFELAYRLSSSVNNAHIGVSRCAYYL
jgi:hypothetical protein